MKVRVTKKALALERKKEMVALTAQALAKIQARETATKKALETVMVKVTTRETARTPRTENTGIIGRVRRGSSARRANGPPRAG